MRLLNLLDSCLRHIYSIADVGYTVNSYAAATDWGSDAVVGLVVERAANVAAGVLPITDVSLVCYDRGWIYGAYRTSGRYEHRSSAQTHARMLWQLGQTHAQFGRATQ